MIGCLEHPTGASLRLAKLLGNAAWIHLYGRRSYDSFYKEADVGEYLSSSKACKLGNGTDCIILDDTCPPLRWTCSAAGKAHLDRDSGRNGCWTWRLQASLVLLSSAA